MSTHRIQSDSDELPWWLLEWLPRPVLGRALDVGAGDGRLAIWLAEEGFEVDAIERDPTRFAAVRTWAASPRLHPVCADVTGLSLGAKRYRFILAASIFHFLRPEAFQRLASDLQAALRPEGVLMAEVFTTDDPGYEEMRQDGPPDGRHTFRHPLEGWIHYFAPGELRAAFAEMQVLHYEESRRLDPTRSAGYYSAATLVARMPLAG
ncbi:MAG: methyltransferase domain-containing protein [Anaerolineales bacterium]